MHVLPLLAALLLSACATSNPPDKYTPQFVYMVLYGAKFRRYPLANSGAKEKEVDTSEIVGGMCLSPDEWAARERYVLDLEAFKGR